MVSRQAGQQAMALPHHKVQASKVYASSPGMQGALQSINTQWVRTKSPLCKDKIKPPALEVWMC